MEYIAYANMVIANEGENINCHLPQLELNWKKNFKSASLNFVTIAALGMILTQAEIASAAYYVNTNGSCLNVRTGPGEGYPVVTCVSNGTSLKPVIRYRNGFAQLTSGNWVSAQWISSTPGTGYNVGRSVGGQYPEYFNRPVDDTDTYRYPRHHSRHHHRRYRCTDKDYCYNYNPDNGYGYGYDNGYYNYNPGYGYGNDYYNYNPGYGYGNDYYNRS